MICPRSHDSNKKVATNCSLLNWEPALSTERLHSRTASHRSAQCCRVEKHKLVRASRTVYWAGGMDRPSAKTNGVRNAYLTGRKAVPGDGKWMGLKWPVHLGRS